jgi:hypothetical protein
MDPSGITGSLLLQFLDIALKILARFGRNSERLDNAGHDFSDILSQRHPILLIGFEFLCRSVSERVYDNPPDDAP